MSTTTGHAGVVLGRKASYGYASGQSQTHGAYQIRILYLNLWCFG